MTNSPITWKEYHDGGHWIHPQHGVDDIATFLCRAIGIPSPILGEESQTISHVSNSLEVPKQAPRKNGYENTCARLADMSMEISALEKEEQVRIMSERRTLDNMSPRLKPHSRRAPRKMGYEERCEILAKQELEEIERREEAKRKEMLSVKRCIRT